MSTQMMQYHNLMRRILQSGVRQPNRTGVDTLMIPGAMMQFDLSQGFPAITTKKLAFDSVKGELIGFIRAYENAADFRALGCRIWDANANEHPEWLRNPNRKGEDDLGRIYGSLWRDFNGHDQLAHAIRTIITDPTNRRIIISAWEPNLFDQMALPPCHVLYQFIVDTSNRTLHLCMYQRSADMFLGVPFNLASASLLLSIVARLTGYNVGLFSHFLADAHIYVNHLDQVTEQLTRSHYPSPALELSFMPPDEEWHAAISRMPSEYSDKRISERLSAIQPEHINLVGYMFHPAIKAPMAV